MLNFKHENLEVKIKKKTKLFNKISKLNNKSNFILDNLINDLYLYLLKRVPEKVALKASINSKQTFTYYLDYSVEEVKLILENKANIWNLVYKVYPSYVDIEKKRNYIFAKNVIVVNLKNFYLKNIIRYYN